MNAKQIAVQAGISVSTVYKALEDSPKVSDKIKERVKSIIKDAGFSSCEEVYTLARKKKSSSPGISQAAFVILGNNFPATLPLIRGVESALAEENIYLIVAHLPDATSLARFVMKQKFRGLILTGFGYPRFSPAELKFLRKQPVVWIMDHCEEGGDTVMPDDGKIAKTAVEYFQQKGYTRLGFLIPEPGHAAFEKEAGYFLLMCFHRGLRVQLFRTQQLGCDPYTEVLPQCLDQLAAQSPRPECLYVPKDIYVATVYAMLTARGIIPGKDIEIVTGGAAPDYLKGLLPQPRHIDSNIEEVGRQAARQALWRSAHLNAPNTHVVLVPPKPIEESPE